MILKLSQVTLLNQINSVVRSFPIISPDLGDDLVYYHLLLRSVDGIGLNFTTLYVCRPRYLRWWNLGYRNLPLYAYYNRKKVFTRTYNCFLFECFLINLYTTFDAKTRTELQKKTTTQYFYAKNDRLSPKPKL